MTADQDNRNQLTLWLMMLVSIGMYFVIVRLVPPRQAASNPMLVNSLLVVALALVAASIGVKSHFLQKARDLNKPGFRRVALVLALVFCEAASLLGVVAWFVTGSTRSYWLILIGLVGAALHYPGRE